MPFNKYSHRTDAVWADDVTDEFLRDNFDWSNTKPDMRDRVVLAIEAQAETIVACCGPFLRNTVITYCCFDHHFPLSAGNFSLRNGLDDMEHPESVLAISTRA